MPSIFGSGDQELPLHGHQGAVRGSPRQRWINIERAALRKLEQLEVSSRLADLRVPPGNRLELLAADRAGQHSIRINDQWRVCFVWRDGAAHDVEIVDYQ